MAISSIGWPDSINIQVNRNWATNTTTINNQYWYDLSRQFQLLNFKWQVVGTTVSALENSWSAATQNYTIQVPIAWTPEEQATFDQYRKDIEVARLKTVAQKKVADEAADKLVLDLVGQAGYELFKKAGYIEIDSKTKPGVVYRVKRDAVDLYRRTSDGKIVDLKQWLCVHPRHTEAGIYPEGDEVATRILLARFAEDDLWKVSNLHDRKHPALGVAA